MYRIEQRSRHRPRPAQTGPVVATFSAARRWRGAVAALCPALALAVLAAPAWAAKDDVELASRATGATGAKGNGNSFQALITQAISADGRYVAFRSTASNLDPDDDDATQDVFVRDLQTSTTTLVSRATGVGGAKGNDTSDGVAISADGRLVAFHSDATNLHPDDGDDDQDVFVRDLQTNTTTLASRANGATGDKGNDDSSYPSLSADGRFLGFHSNATNLLPDDDDFGSDVYVRDLQTNTNTLVSRASGAAGANGDNFSVGGVISADGRFVAFVSAAVNLDPDDSDTEADVYVRALQTNTTTLVSRATGAAGAKGNRSSTDYSISADGRFVAFRSDASNLHPDDSVVGPDVFVRDLQTNTTTLESRADGATGAKGNFASLNSKLSADGRFVAFASTASNLHPEDPDRIADVFVRDLQTHTNTLVSRAAGAAGVKGNGTSRLPLISADGRFVAFQSTSSNLHPDDADTLEDLFRRDVLGPPRRPRQRRRLRRLLCRRRRR